MPRPPTSWHETYERHLLALQARTGVPGMGVTLFTADDVLLSRGLGFRDREAGLPVTDDTLFGIASVTKSVTALAVLQLVTDGRLSLDDPVSQHLPFTLWDGREPARIRHFLSHTSGLPALPTMDWVRAPSQLDDPVTGRQAEKRVANPVPDVRTPERLVAWIDANAVLLGEPGEVFSYSNDAFCLLGGVVLSNLVDIPSEGVWVSGVNARTGVPVDARSYAPGSYAASAAEVAEVLGRYASAEPYGRLRLYLGEDGALRASVGEPEKDVPARFAAADEIALTFPEREAPATLLRGDDGGLRGVTYGLRVLLREA